MSPLLQVRNLSKTFSLKREQLYVLVDVSLDLFAGETLGLVGESGCGKSTLGKIIMNLESATSGECLFNGENTLTLSDQDLLSYRKKVQMVFQDPYASLNPRMSLYDIITEPLVIHHRMSKKELEHRAKELVNLVGLPLSYLRRFPHQLSGGQRQRVGIARAIALSPKLLICDEPTSALDASVQAQIVTLLEKLQEEIGLSYLLISHNLSLIKYLSPRIAVMYLGQIVETGPRDLLYKAPLHPYTQALLSAIPLPDPKQEREKKQIFLTGEIPSPTCRHKGCPFASRCPNAMEICREKKPELKEVVKGHYAACHLH